MKNIMRIAEQVKIKIMFELDIDKNYKYKNCIKITKGEGKRHRMTKFLICSWATENNYLYYCEPKLVTYFCQPDVVVFIDGAPHAFEIIDTEKPRSIESKLKRYPHWLKLQAVNVDDDINRILESLS